jgi:hypothetical protein
MRSVSGALFSGLLVAFFGSCGQSVPTSETADLLAAVGGTNRPLKGTCDVVVAQRTHEAGEEGGGCSGGGGGEEDPAGGPPIPRHYNLTGTCQLTHLGRVQVEGRLNVTGPFGMGGNHGGQTAASPEGEGGHGGGLAVRGRLMFVAANGDQLTGRYVPVATAFTKNGTGGTLAFTSTQKIGEACTGHEDEGGGGNGMGGPGGGMGGGEEGEHEEPVSTGRFTGATGEVTLLGNLTIVKSSKSGKGRITLTDGLLTY